MGSDSKHSNKIVLMVIALVLNLVAVVALFFPIINLHYINSWGFSFKQTIAGYQFLFGSGNSFVDFIIDNVNDAKKELTILAIIFMAVPEVVTIFSAIIKLVCRERKAGSIVPIVFQTICIIEIALFFNATSYSPAVGMVIFLIVTVLSIIMNIVTLVAESRAGKSVTEGKDVNKEQNAQQEYKLKGVSGVYAGATIKLGEKPVWIGRDSSQCNVILDGGKVSRQHCCIWLNNIGKVMIRDTSTNGVYFPNGDRLLSNIDTELHIGDTIFIGNSENSFQVV